MKEKLVGKNREGQTPLRYKATEGQAALEMLIALAILVFATSAAIMMAFGSQVASVGTETNAEALLKAAQQIEEARALSRQNFNSVNSLFSTYTSGPLTYNLNLDVISLDSFTKKVTSNVSWVSGGQTLSVALSTLLTDWVSGGSKCSPTLSGDWTEPQIYGYADFPSSAGATGLSVSGGKAYITSDPSSHGTDDFYVIDVTSAGPGQTTLPVLGSFSTTYGLTDVETQGGFSYVAANSAAYQMLVIDVSDPASLDVSKIKSKTDVTVSGDTAVGHSIFLDKKKIYLGLTMSSGPEFYIIDVSNPAAPVVQGSYEVGGAVNQILVKNNIAYLSTAANQEVIVLDISNPLTPTYMGSYDSPTLTGQGLEIDTPGTTLYFGRTGGNGNPKLLALDPGNLSLPRWTMDMNHNSGVYTMTLRSNLLFMTTADPNDGLQIWDVSGASATVPPTRHGTSPLNIQQTATAGSDCVGNLLYVGQRSNRALQVVGPYVPNVYSLSNTGDVVVNQGGSGNTTIINTLVSGVPASITLNNSALPAGATRVWVNNPCTSTCSSQITISTALSTPVGTYPITITGTGGVTTVLNLVVNPQTFNYTLSSPSNIAVLRAGVSVSNSVIVTMIAGSPTPVTLTPSGLPAGVSVSPASASCTPSATAPYQCSVSFNYSASGQATLGSATITLNGASPVRSASFTLAVNAPAFDYTLPDNWPDPFVINRGGPSVPLAVIVNMAPGAVSQSVTITPPNPSPADIIISPISDSCAPDPTTYQCTKIFNYSSPPGGKKTYSNQRVMGSPGSVQSNKFQIKLN